MKILALNSSPRVTGQSKTELLLSHLVAGMQNAGAEVEVIELRKKKINYCRGCFTCWTKTPGACVHKDDMALELFPKWLEADIVVYASPLYHYGVNAQMKALIERTVPSLLPYFERKGERTVHPLRGRLPTVVLISVAGFPDDSVFDALSFWAKKTFGRGTGLLAEIYRPAAEAMVHSWKLKDILDATEQAGREIVEQRSVTQETMARIQQPLHDPAIVAATSNLMWQTLIDERLTMAEAGKQGHAPRPDSITALMAMLSFAFNPLKTGDKKGTLQFNFTGKTPGSCYFVIDKNNCTAHEGKAEKVDCTIDGPFEVWADIIQGKADGAKMLMDGKYKAEGDIALMMVFGAD
ncbi:NAD(P)H-dependent oxidoreductase [Chloroflexota bacterium]